MVAGTSGLDALEAEDEAYLSSQLLTYLGNKRALLGLIGEGVSRVTGAMARKIRFFDAFAGSGVVSRFMKRYASLIVANDLERYGEVVSRCYLTNRSDLDEAAFGEVFERWRAHAEAHPEPGVLTRLYAPEDDAAIRPGERVFYTRENALALDSARRAVDAVVPPAYADLVLGPLLAEASIHANTSGVFKGFYKDRRGVGAFGGEGRHALSRICGRIKLEKPVLSRFSCESRVLRGDANAVVRTLPEVDLAYFDPPYNQHPYGSNYFMLNVLAEAREPTRPSAVSGIPSDWNRSRYNRREEAAPTLFELLSATPARYLMVSYSSEGFIAREALVAFLSTLGEVTSLATAYNAFRGSRNLRNRPQKVTEFLFLVKRR